MSGHEHEVRALLPDLLDVLAGGLDLIEKLHGRDVIRERHLRRVGRREPDDRHLNATVVLDDVGNDVLDRLAGFGPDEIGREDRHLRHLDQVPEVLEPLVEVVVAHGPEVEIHRVEVLDHRLALLEVTDGRPLENVALVHDKNVATLCFRTFSDRTDVRRGRRGPTQWGRELPVHERRPASVDTAVDVIREDDRQPDEPILARRGRDRRRHDECDCHKNGRRASDASHNRLLLPRSVRQDTTACLRQRGPRRARSRLGPAARER